MATTVSSVQYFGQRSTWPDNVVYVGMPGPAARGFGISDDEAGPFGKPWEFRYDPRGWAAAYVEYLARRLLFDQRFAEQVKALDGKMLLCYCTRKAEQRGTEVACHARILREYVDMLNGREPE